MISAYRIGVNILAVNGVSPTLRIISRDVLGLGRQIDAVSAKFGRWRLASIAIGAAVAGIGTAALVSELKLAKMGDRLLQQRQALRAVGVSPATADAAISQSIAVASRTPGLVPSEAAKLVMEMRAALGSTSEAMVALPSVARSFQSLHFAGLSDVASEMKAIFRAVDIMGAAVKGGHTDPQAFAEAVRWITQISIATGGLLTPSAFLRIAQTGGAAAQMGTFQQFMMGMGPMFMQLGPRAGTALSNLMMQFVGGKTTGATVRMMEDFGLLKQGGFTRIIGGGMGSFFIKPGALYGYNDLINPQKGFAYWIAHDLPKALQEHGVKQTPQAVIQALARITGSQRALRGLINLLTPQGQVLASKEREVFLKAVGADALSQQMKALQPNIDALTGSFKALSEVVGMQLVPLVIRFIQPLTTELQKATRWAAANPQTVTTILKVVGALGAAFLALGAAAVVTALVTLVGPSGLLIALATGITALGVAFSGAFGKGTLGGTILGYLKTAAAALVPGGITGPLGAPLVNAHGYNGSINSPLLMPMPAVPSAKSSTQPVTVTGHVLATVTNGKDIAHGVSKKQSQDLLANPSGPTGFNGSRSFLPPSLPMLPPGP